MKIRTITACDIASWCKMRNMLWPEEAERNNLEANKFFDGSSKLSDVLMAEIDGELAGFIELSIRDFATGSSSFSVPYIEAWFVQSEYRGQHIGSLLIAEAEKWAMEKGFSELASDTEIENQGSIQKHIALGFTEVGRTIHFMKKLI